MLPGRACLRLSHNEMTWLCAVLCCVVTRWLHSPRAHQVQMQPVPGPEPHSQLLQHIAQLGSRVSSSRQDHSLDPIRSSIMASSST